MAKRKLDPLTAEGGDHDVAPAKKARRARASKTKDLVERTNALDVTAFPVDAGWLSYRPKDSEDDYGILFTYSTTMPEEDLEACFCLVDTTSRPDYEASSWGWHPKRKRREMREPEMRYLTVRRKSSGAAETAHCPIEGFLSFMITHDSEPPVPVLYVYEIHLAEKLRKVGLGHHLMQIAEDVAGRIELQKVMLTCFLSNVKARQFYERRGYATDVSSPGPRKTRNKTVKPDYVIMSKVVSPKAHEVSG